MLNSRSPASRTPSSRPKATKGNYLVETLPAEEVSYHTVRVKGSVEFYFE